MATRPIEAFAPQLGRTALLEAVSEVPLLVMQESDARYLFRLPVVGLRASELRVNLNDNVLSISGTYEDNHAKRKKFRRTFSLPHPVSDENPRIQEDMNYLTIHVNKRADLTAPR